MNDHLYLVLSQRPDSVSEADYDAWYAQHVRENLEAPGFHAARRYRIDSVRGSAGAGYHHLAAYAYDGDIHAMRRELAARSQSGAIVLPPWFDDITFQSWDCTALEDRIERTT